MRLDNKKVDVFLYKYDNGYQFLILKRTKEKGNYWQPIVWGMEDFDQEIKVTALRESQEEAGILNDKIKKEINDFYQFWTEYKWVKAVEHCFAFEVEIDCVVNIESNICHEHQEYRWCSVKEAKDLFRYDNHKKALDELVKILEKIKS